MYSPSGDSASITDAQAQTNTENSIIKGNIETWYSNNLSTFSSYLADTLWCNDRSIESGLGFGTNITIYKAKNRLDS